MTVTWTWAWRPRRTTNIIETSRTILMFNSKPPTNHNTSTSTSTSTCISHAHHTHKSTKNHPSIIHHPQSTTNHLFHQPADPNTISETPPPLPLSFFSPPSHLPKKNSTVNIYRTTYPNTYVSMYICIYVLADPFQTQKPKKIKYISNEQDTSIPKHQGL